jgi:hypothetical protein
MPRNLGSSIENGVYCGYEVTRSLAMAVKYPNMFFIRLTHEDRKRIKEASEKAEIPPSTLARKVLRQWLRSTEVDATEMEKTAS